jgi:hypothetical protein
VAQVEGGAPSLSAGTARAISLELHALAALLAVPSKPPATAPAVLAAITTAVSPTAPVSLLVDFIGSMAIRFSRTAALVCEAEEGQTRVHSSS